MTGVEIRIAEPSDLDGINFIRDCISEDVTSPHSCLSALSVSLIEKRDNQFTFVAKKDAVIVGYLSLRNSTSLQQRVDADFEMFVRPGDQKKGIGTELIRFAEDYVATKTNISRLTLGVMNANQNARKLYEKNGFYSLGKDSIGERMAKDIKR